MGVHDRDYARAGTRRVGPDGPGAPRGRGLRRPGWSVNTWLIAACVAVFVIGGFLPFGLMADGPPFAAGDVVTVQSKSLQGVVGGDDTSVIHDASGERFLALPLTDQGRTVGWQPVLPTPLLQKWLHFSTDRGFLAVQFWRFVGFQFLHANLTHLVFNMIGLFFFGPLVEKYLGGKRYLAFYLLCGICGAVLYLALNLAGYVVSDVMQSSATIPGLLFNDTATPLIGASAGVFGVLLAGAFLAPNVRVLVFFILPMKLATLAWALVAISVFSVLFGGQNAGGEAAHLGGAIAGFYFIRHPRHLQGFFDFLGRVDPSSEHFALRQTPAGPGDVDRILDKIHRKGLNSLSAKEKRLLHDASRTRRGDS